MGFTYYGPDPALRDYIENVIVVNFYLTEEMPPVVTFVPDYHQYLCFILEDKINVLEEGHFIERGDAILVGSHLGPTKIALGKKHNAVYVQFKPAGLYALFNVPQEEMLNCCYDARVFIEPAQINRLVERLSAASTADTQNQLLQLFLIERLSKSKLILPFDRAIHAFVEKGGNLSIEQTAAFSCVSLRQFERLCKSRLGLSPKIFGRLIRFSNVYKLKELYPDLSWCQMALKCGYYDHMHMIRDFKQFTGINPKVVEDEGGFRSFPYDRV